MDELVEGQGDTFQARYEAAVEECRKPLMKAQAILNCMVFSMNYHHEMTEELSVSVGDLAVAGEVVGEFVHQAWDQLDVVNLLKAVRGQGLSSEVGQE